MLTLTKPNAAILAVVLSLAMWATRGHHAASLTHLPDASWALFFLVGFYFRSRLLLALFFAQAAVIDYLSITQFGVSDYCVTPAYAFLLPAYFSLWLGGRWYAAHYQVNVRSLLSLGTAALASTFACELISSGSFYFLGGRFAETSVGEFAHRLVQYFPGNLANVALYLAAAALIHAVIAGLSRPAATA